MNLFPLSRSEFSGSAGQTLASRGAADLALAHETIGPGGVKLLSSYNYAVSIIVVSFNTKDLLRDCIQSILDECNRLSDGLSAEILVVDNASGDGSAAMVAKEFGSSDVPVRLMRSDINLGFAGANNLAMESALGRYLVLLNSDAFFHPGSLCRAIEKMNADPLAGVGGARLVGPAGEWQPSARAFPTIWLTFLVYSGLASRFPKSRIFGAFDRTWASPDLEAEVDWVPGAFSIMRREALVQSGLFDPQFFLYSEEVDLCRRIKANGFRVLYWPDVVVTHIGGESSRQLTTLKFSDSEAQVVLWRMRAHLLYFRKHHGMRVWGIRCLEDAMHALRWLRNRRSRNPARRERAQEAKLLLSLMRQAWKETNGGRVSPPRPW
ncbi:MAG: glycosyltransferase family 2 protein [Terracidiphilus sp.]